MLAVLIGVKKNHNTVSITSTKTPAHYMIVSLASMDSIPSECEALNLVVFSNIVNFIIYDIIVLYYL